MVEHHQYDIHQDVVTQLPALNGYTNTVRGFATGPSITRETVVAQLQTAWDEIRGEIPFLGHQVVVLDAAPGTSGFIKSVPWPSSAPPNNIDAVDKVAEFPSLSQLAASRQTLDESRHLIPFPGLPGWHGLDVIPVMMLRAVFIEGGVLIVMSTHHNIIDGIGLLQLWDHLATIINGGKLSEQSIREANADRSYVLPLLLPGEELKDYSHLIRPDPWPLPPPPTTEWRVFMMPRAALADIKKRANITDQADGLSVRISTDDALSAFCWQRLSVVRLRSGRVNAHEMSKFGRAVSGRGAMGLGATYLGHMMLHAATYMTIGQLTERSLAELSRIMRRDLEEARTEWSVRSYATFLAKTPDKSTIMYGGITNPRTDLGGTSVLPWATRPQFKMGLLGSSRLFRKPSGAQIPACMYFLPSDDTQGSIQVFLCLTKGELDSLTRDEEWKRYFELNEDLDQKARL